MLKSPISTETGKKKSIEPTYPPPVNAYPSEQFKRCRKAEECDLASLCYFQVPNRPECPRLPPQARK